MSSFYMIFHLLTIIGLYLVLKEVSGPFGIISDFRNWLMINKYIGTFFYQLISCPICLGFWTSIIIALLHHNFNILDLFLNGLQGSAICLIFQSCYDRLNS